MDEAVAILARTPATLDALLRGLSHGWIVAHEGGDTWSPFDIVGHLIHADRTNWVVRVQTILEHGEAGSFQPFDRFAQFEATKGRAMASLLDEFASVREGSLRQLAALHLLDVDLDRRGRHPDLGVVTLRQLLSTWVAHDLDHVVQVSRVLAHQVLGRGRPLARLSPHRSRDRIVTDAVRAGERLVERGRSGIRVVVPSPGVPSRRCRNQSRSHPVS